jgi:organic radical activating enzyme
MNIKNIELIELNVTDSCTRKCSFCPQSVLQEFNNNSVNSRFMSEQTFDTVFERIVEYGNNDIIVVFCGFGEPLKNKNIFYGIEKFSKKFKTRVVTNGDLITEDTLVFFKEKQLYNLKIDIYDNVEQTKNIISLLNSVDYSGMVAINNRYNKSPKENFFNNRGGIVDVDSGIQNAINTECSILSYKLFIDYSGQYLQCSADFSRRSDIALQKYNIYNLSIFDYLTTEEYLNCISKMKETKRQNITLCKNCNTSGIRGLYESKFDYWKRI